MGQVTARYCGSCGQAQVEGDRYCQSCGKESAAPSRTSANPARESVEAPAASDAATRGKPAGKELKFCRWLGAYCLAAAALALLPWVAQSVVGLNPGLIYYAPEVSLFLTAAIFSLRGHMAPVPWLLAAYPLLRLSNWLLLPLVPVPLVGSLTNFGVIAEIQSPALASTFVLRDVVLVTAIAASIVSFRHIAMTRDQSRIQVPQ